MIVAGPIEFLVEFWMPDSTQFTFAKVHPAAAPSVTVIVFPAPKFVMVWPAILSTPGPASSSIKLKLVGPKLAVAVNGNDVLADVPPNKVITSILIMTAPDGTTAAAESERS